MNTALLILAVVVVVVAAILAYKANKKQKTEELPPSVDSESIDEKSYPTVTSTTVSEEVAKEFALKPLTEGKTKTNVKKGTKTTKASPPPAPQPKKSKKSKKS